MHPLVLFIRSTSSPVQGIISRNSPYFRLTPTTLHPRQPYFPRLSNRLLHCASSNLVKMPTYIVTAKDDATDEQVAALKKQAVDQGGKIGHEYTLIKGFSVDFPEDQISTLQSHEHVKAVEKDQEVKTQ